MPDPNAHTLTLVFHRFLSEDEWREVVTAVRDHVPYLVELVANAVVETPEELERNPTCHSRKTMQGA